MKRVSLIVGFLILLLGVVLDIIAISTTEWLTSSTGDSGLWELCPDEGSCVGIGGDNDLDAVRGTMVLGIFLAGFAVIVAAIEIFYFIGTYSITPWVTPSVCASTFLAALLTLTGFLVFQTEIYDDATNVDRGFSFWLAVVAFLLFMLAGGVFIFAAVRDYKLLRMLKRREKERMYLQDAQYRNAAYVNAVSRNDRYMHNNWPPVREPSPKSLSDPVLNNPDYHYGPRPPFKVYDHGVAVIGKDYRGSNSYRGDYGGKSYRNGYGGRSDRWARDPYGYPMNYIRD